MHKGTNKKGAFSTQWLIESISLLFCLAVILVVVANASPTGGGSGNQIPHTLNITDICPNQPEPRQIFPQPVGIIGRRLLFTR